MYSQSTAFTSFQKKESSFYYNLPNLLAIEWTSKGFLEHDKRSIEKRMEGRLCIQVTFQSAKGLWKTDFKEKVNTKEEGPGFLTQSQRGHCVCLQRAGRRFHSRNLCLAFWSSFERAAKSSPQSAWRAQSGAFRFKSSGSPRQAG